MRVLHVITDLGSYGAERLVTRLLKTLREPGLELGVMTIYSTPDGAPDIGVPVFDVARRGRYDPGFLPRMIQMMRAWKPDVVHTHMHNGKYWGRIAAIAAGVGTLVHTEHNSEFGAPGVFRIVNRMLIGRTAAFVAFSQTHRRTLAADEGIDPERIVVIPNGIELSAQSGTARQRARAALGVGDDVPVLMHVGRLSAVKNQALTIDALALLPPPTQLFFAGDGSDRNALEARARERGVTDRLTFLGYRADAADLVAGADVALIASLNEAMPLAAIEALVAGAPVISVPWNGAREILGDGAFGVVVDDYTPRALADAVRAALADRVASHERADRARAFARNEYDIVATARRHAQLYRELAAQAGPAKRLVRSARS